MHCETRRYIFELRLFSIEQWTFDLAESPALTEIDPFCLAGDENTLPYLVKPIRKENIATFRLFSFLYDNFETK